MTEGRNNKADAQTLKQLAIALDVPVETFFDPIAHAPTKPSALEEEQLLDLFRKILDPRERACCLALVRVMANLARGEADGSRMMRADPLPRR